MPEWDVQWTSHPGLLVSAGQLSLSVGDHSTCITSLALSLAARPEQWRTWQLLFLALRAFRAPVPLLRATACATCFVAPPGVRSMLAQGMLLRLREAETETETEAGLAEVPSLPYPPSGSFPSGSQHSHNTRYGPSQQLSPRPYSASAPLPLPLRKKADIYLPSPPEPPSPHLIPSQPTRKSSPSLALAHRSSDVSGSAPIPYPVCYVLLQGAFSGRLTEARLPGAQACEAFLQRYAFTQQLPNGTTALATDRCAGLEPAENDTNATAVDIPHPGFRTVRSL